MRTKKMLHEGNQSLKENSDRPRVSVIVPVYNKKSYLSQCLDSLVQQTLRDIEILCVDDKSADSSLDILNKYAKEDDRIKVFARDTNKGVSAARNLGMKRACGEFIAFVDADDFVDADFYEKLYSASAGYDCVKGEMWDYNAATGQSSVNKICDLNGRIKQTNNPIYFHHGFQSAIYKKEYIDKYGLCFCEEISFNEDPLFVISFMARLPKLKVADGAKYNYRIVESSLSHYITPEKVKDFCRSMPLAFSYLEHCSASYENKSVIAKLFVSMASSFLIQGGLNDEMLSQMKTSYISFLKDPHGSDKVKVSVIVPVYNGEKTLRRALDSLVLQSLHDIEIICVNDASTDNSLTILKEYQKEDERVKVIDCKENGGESKARNIGIRAAAGEFIAFMDQDDQLDLTFYDALYERAADTHADIVKGEAAEVLYDKRMVKPDIRADFEKQPLYFIGEWWTAIYSRKLIMQHQIELPEGLPLGGDIKFQFDACSVCEKMSVVNGVYYYHIMRTDSGDSEETPLYKTESAVKVFSYILNKVENSDLYEKDRGCYIHYYFSYIQHSYDRINRCSDTEGKMLLIDFEFAYYGICRCKKEVITRLQQTTPLLADVLEKNRRDFFKKLMGNDVLSDVFFEEAETDSSAPCGCTLVVSYSKPDHVNKYITQNAFLKQEEKLTFHLMDNTRNNESISAAYNSFLDNCDYSRDSWFIFADEDFEFLTFPSRLTDQLDPAKIYGPVGAKAYRYHMKVRSIDKGNVFEKTSGNKFYHDLKYKHSDLSVDTLDGLCMIVHSSLVKKYDLRFDEKPGSDLYAEDFCISARKRYGIPAEVVYFDCAYHSPYKKIRSSKERYFEELEYLNEKYPDDLYGGTKGLIGGEKLPEMTDREFKMFKIRHELQTKEKLG